VVKEVTILTVSQTLTGEGIWFYTEGTWRLGPRQVPKCKN
jgi:hypothetical protein